MKKIIIMLLFASSIASTSAQASLETKERFCEVTCKQNGLTQKVTATIDSGQTTINSKQVFESNVQVLNFMSNNGWQFVTCYSTTGGGGYVIWYLFKKRD